MPHVMSLMIHVYMVHVMEMFASAMMAGQALLVVQWLHFVTACM